MKGIKHQNIPLMKTIGLEAADPLWKRVPTRDENGIPLADFMMLIPKLNQQDQQSISAVINKLQLVLTQYQDVIVFADLNMKINVLWVSLRPHIGMCTEIPQAIIKVVPKAKVIGENSCNTEHHG